MNKQEAIAAYGDVPLKFSGYYKYSFSFGGVAPDGAKVMMSVGGNADDIYRFDVGPDSQMTLKDGYSAAAVTKDDEKLWSDYDC